MEEEHKKILSMFLYFLGIIILFSVIRAISPAIQRFFESQTSLMSIIAAYPLHILIVLAFILALLQKLYYKFFMDKGIIEQIKNAKQESKELQKKIKEYKDNPEQLAKLQKEMFAKSMHASSASMKSMFTPKAILLNYIPSILIIFIIVGPIYMAANVGFILPVTLPLLGKVGGWLFCIFLFIFIFSLILKKIMKTEF